MLVQSRQRPPTTTVAVLKEVETTLGKKGRVLLRRSGTEPLVRVMVEGIDENRISQLANQLADVVKQELA